MMDALVSGLRSCLAEQPPSIEQRKDLSDALLSLGKTDPSFAELLAAPSQAIAAAATRRELAVAAAHAMRLLAQRSSEQAEAVQSPSTRERARERARSRARSRAPREQERASQGTAHA